jgi:hypothetical protein
MKTRSQSLRDRFEAMGRLLPHQGSDDVAGIDRCHRLSERDCLDARGLR